MKNVIIELKKMLKIKSKLSRVINMVTKNVESKN